ncbi:hypothetical protein [Chitinimonas sp. BJB300]|uniref:hypothetical protein n=1 Tax=Chitinimonas sp. BJB300 TaxID=1559339 RepID=UPI000C0EE866|nr:hypothetical protein [Chitinimonas sp. BJB300]PHV13151.1 hypothetical protein CSQ89_01775 [Chitinimonas sp. BJB300]TSJ87132.1 hypothetical protein FG002_015275 [Chitinimonas sp. BJB300]
MHALAPLPDPRSYSGTATHSLHHLAHALLGERNLGHLVAKEAALDTELKRLLSQGDDAAIAAALATAPDLATLRVLNERLRANVEHAVAGQPQHAVIFALPVVLVAGVRGKHTIAGKLPDIGAVQALLVQHGVIQAGADIQLSSKLLDHDQLRGIQPSQLARWRDALQYASGGLPHDFTEAPVNVDGDGVFLRYIVGIAMQPADATPVVQLNAAPGQWALALTKLLGDQLEHDAMTLFPLPRAPQAWLAALDDGRVAQQEIRFQVFASNTLRKLRETGETPVAVLSCHEGAELRVTLGAEKNGEEWAGFIWPLGQFDRVEALQQMMVELLRECHHDDIRVLGEVLPQIKDNLPYFPLPTELPAALARH